MLPPSSVAADHIDEAGVEDAARNPAAQQVQRARRR